MTFDPDDPRWIEIQAQIARITAPAMEQLQTAVAASLAPAMARVSETLVPLVEQQSRVMMETIVKSPGYQRMVEQLEAAQFNFVGPEFVLAVAEANDSRLETIAAIEDPDVRSDLRLGLQASVTAFVLVLIILTNRDIPAPQLLAKAVDSITDALVDMSVLGLLTLLFRPTD